MAAIDSSIVLISLPTIVNKLPGTSAGEALWVVMSYLLVTATLILNFGRLGDMFGRVKMYNSGFAIFTIGSFLCSVSQSGNELVSFRIVQGIGAAFLWANSAAIITDAFPRNERGRALGINQVSIVVGSVVGLVLGGILTQALGWRSIFWVNVPIGIFGTIWAHKKLKEVSTIKLGEKLDVVGNASFVIGLVMVLMGITFGALSGWSSSLLSMILIGVVILAAFAYIETKVKQPMFQLSLFKIPIFTAGNLSILCNGLSRGAFSFMMVFYLQSVIGLGPLTAGLWLVPLSVAIACFGPFSGWLSDRHGAKYFAIIGLAASGLGFVVMSQLPTKVTFVSLLAPLVLLGAGSGFFAAPNRSTTLSSVPPERRGIAAGINTVLMNIAQLLSLGLSVAILSASVPRSVIVTVLGGGTAAVGTFDVGLFMGGLHTIYYLSAVISVLGIGPVYLAFRNEDDQKLEERSASPKIEDRVSLG
jgi:EmrB/QacA subfamily drug resistance transporter